MVVSSGRWWKGIGEVGDGVGEYVGRQSRRHFGRPVGSRVANGGGDVAGGGGKYVGDGVDDTFCTNVGNGVRDGVREQVGDGVCQHV